MTEKPFGFEGVAGKGLSAPPPPGSDPATSSRPQQPPLRLAYQDFFPRILQTGGFSSAQEYERFDILIQRANQWLQSNPGIEVKTCESLEKIGHRKAPADPDQSVRHEARDKHHMVRGLRVWYGPKSTSSGNPDQLGYINFVPDSIKSGGSSSYPEFERLDVVLSKVNRYLQEQPLPGRIVTIETQDIKLTGTWSPTVIDPDICCWVESGNSSKLYLFLIRIFYITGPAQYEEVGVADFVPDVKSSGSVVVFTLPTSEPFPSVLSRARAWIKEQQGIRVTNVKTLDIKMHKSAFSSRIDIDSQKTSYEERGRSNTVYVRAVRIAYARPRDPLPPTEPLLLTCRTFVPGLLRKRGAVLASIPSYENQSEALQRVMAWLNATGAAVLSTETVELKVLGRGETDEEASAYVEFGSELVVYVSALRLYLHGIYQEPPPEALPAMPPPPEDSCCLVL